MAKRKYKKRSTPKKLATDAKHIMAYRLKMAGAKLQDIADALGYKTCSGAQVAIEAGQRKLHIDPAIDSKSLNQDRLEALLQNLWSAAMKGALGSTDRVLKIIRELNKMDGNYEPVRLEVEDWRSEVIQLFREGKITQQDIFNEFGKDLATELFVSAGIQVNAGGQTEDDG